jgi:hypothetical protein
MRRTWLALVMCVAGCATNAAQRAFDQGDYAAAARLAEQDAARDPSDTHAAALVSRSHDRYVATQAPRIDALLAGQRTDAALAMLGGLLKDVDDWGGPSQLSGPAQDALRATVAGAQKVVRDVGAAALTSGRPLTVEADLARLSPLLRPAELAAARDDAAASIRTAGQQTCARLRASPASPNWALIVARYCAHFGDGAAPPLAASSPAPLAVAGGVAGLSRAGADLLRARLDEWLRASLWARVGDPPPARASMGGKFEVSFQRASVTLHAPYEATVTSHTTLDRNPLAEDLANAFRSVNLPAHGDATTRGQVTSVYAYDAEESRGRYSLNAQVTFDLGPGGPTVVNLRREENLKAYEHDVTFEPAGIFPRHDSIPSGEAWLPMQLDRARPLALRTLNRQFLATFCGRRTYELEDAARCLVVGPNAAATKTVAATIGDDEQRLTAILVPPPPPAPKENEPAARPAPRRRARPAQSGATDEENPTVE